MDFDASKAVEATVKWIQDWFAENGPDCNAIIGISGGKDSSITAALLVEALGKDRVIGIMMPNGEQSDMDMALLLVNHLGINHYVINIAAAYNGAVKDIECVIGELSNDSLINLAPRLRMATLYAVGQSRNGRVANTCNLSEDWVGYSTRYGDAAGDFSPISSFTTAEIRAMGRVLGVPDILIEKVPSDGLSGMSDEDKLGFTYEVLDRYIRTGEIEDATAKERIDTLHERNLFKLRYMDSFKYEG
ncbi:NAD(+) synthase [Mogibacterium timidum]|uniref:NH(3)-dependent NAD(+) synthetase n=1 Tax=Mogibacterium timidum ATCC 33093 TaxID=1401079 RepID=X8IQ87_9FIRM|nr:NAD(+) synthase [Mogibacterium timidum]EUC51970.1 NAD+ synthetase [Mogibacterium timidum ATCC 33093]